MIFVFLDLGLFIHYDNLFSCSTRGSLFLPKRQKLSEIKRQHFLEKVVKKWVSVNISIAEWIKYPKINLKLLETKAKGSFFFVVEVHYNIYAQENIF